MDQLNSHIRNRNHSSCMQFVAGDPTVKAALTTNINYDEYIHNSPQSALHLAAYLGRILILRGLIEQGANVNSAVYSTNVTCTTGVARNWSRSGPVMNIESVLSAAVRYDYAINDDAILICKL